MSFEDMEKVRLLAQQAVAYADIEGTTDLEKTRLACQVLDGMTEEQGIDSPVFFTEIVVLAQTKLYRILSNGNAHSATWRTVIPNTNSSGSSNFLD